MRAVRFDRPRANRESAFTAAHATIWREAAPTCAANSRTRRGIDLSATRVFPLAFRPWEHPAFEPRPRPPALMQSSDPAARPAPSASSTAVDVAQKKATTGLAKLARPCACADHGLGEQPAANPVGVDLTNAPRSPPERSATRKPNSSTRGKLSSSTPTHPRPGCSRKTNLRVMGTPRRFE